MERLAWLCLSMMRSQSLADALELLLNDAGLRVRLAQAARRLIEQEFDIERNAAQIRTLYGHLTNVYDSRQELEVV